eukprot:CAMPEP_0172919588 /NCGR_PEP_ID=MMETSP1075-20121228/202425_1 /TAXON_ID=2916 /ORGANISM="Ceratium fusus, Strain PA161109" /LENGTH=130 /DNA_ID=CAMNT_0013779459 /DNA_START=135 /DNA_END=525 /DNA_ORIENTATION=+
MPTTGEVPAVGARHEGLSARGQAVLHPAVQTVAVAPSPPAVHKRAGAEAAGTVALVGLASIRPLQSEALGVHPAALHMNPQGVAQKVSKEQIIMLASTQEGCFMMHDDLCQWPAKNDASSTSRMQFAALA